MFIECEHLQKNLHGHEHHDSPCEPQLNASWFVHWSTSSPTRLSQLDQYSCSMNTLIRRITVLHNRSEYVEIKRKKRVELLVYSTYHVRLRSVILTFAKLSTVSSINLQPVGHHHNFFEKQSLSEYCCLSLRHRKNCISLQVSKEIKYLCRVHQQIQNPSLQAMPYLLLGFPVFGKRQHCFA